jgi:hypothetical protein
MSEIIVLDHESYVVSIDIGPKNTAITCMDASDLQVKWIQLRPVTTELNVASTARSVSAIIHEIHASFLKDADVIYLVEKQLISGGRCVPAMMYNCIIESAIVSAFESLHVRWLSVDPREVRAYYDMPSGYREKKRAAADIIHHLFEDEIIILSDEARDVYNGIRKKDDVSDSKLQALFYSIKNLL